MARVGFQEELPRFHETVGVRSPISKASLVIFSLLVALDDCAAASATQCGFVALRTNHGRALFRDKTAADCSAAVRSFGCLAVGLRNKQELIKPLRR